MGFCDGDVGGGEVLESNFELIQDVGLGDEVWEISF